MLAETTEIENLESGDLDPIKQQQINIDKSFIKSGLRTVGKFTLQPYSASREVAAQAMGLHYGYVTSAGKDRFERTKLYPGALRDVAIVFWLCASASEDEIDAAGIEPIQAAKKAIRWAGDNDLLNTEGETFWEAYAVFFDIMAEIWDSRSSPKKKSTTSTNVQ